MTHRPFRTFAALALLLALAAALGLRFGLRVGWIISLIAAVNIATFTLYAYDKRAAGTSHGRVPEAVLHLLALFGGSPAAFAAQQILRHKTVKRSFQFTFWGIVVIQAGGAIWYFSTMA